MKRKKIKFVLLTASALLSTSVAAQLINSNVNIVAHAETASFTLDASNTKIEGAGVSFAIAEKPAIMVDDFTVTIVDFISNEYSNYKDAIMDFGFGKDYYDPTSGILYGMISNGFPNGCDVRIIFNVSYTVGSTTYEKEVCFDGNVYNPNYGLEAISAPTNIVLDENNVLTFDAVDGATGYVAQYRYDNKVDVAREKEVVTGETLDAVLAPGTYYIFVKALGDGSTVADSEYAEASGTYSPGEVEVNPINIEPSESKISGAAIFIFLADKPQLIARDITVKITDFISVTYDGYKDGILRGGFSMVEYNTSTGRVFGTMANGFPDNADITIKMTISYAYQDNYYSQDIVFVKGVYNPNYGQLEALSAPTNVTIVDGVITFDAVEHASSYALQYRLADSTLIRETPVVSGDALSTNLDAGTYHIFVKAVGDSVTYDDSLFVEASSTWVITERALPTLGVDIKIDTDRTRISGAGVEIYLTDIPELTKEEIQVKLVSFQSNTYSADKGIMESTGLRKEVYDDVTGRLYCVAAKGYEDGGDQKHIIRISYVKDRITYLQELVFEGNVYKPTLATDCHLGYALAYGEQISLDNTKIRYISKVYVGDKSVANLASTYKSLGVSVTYTVGGVEQTAELSTIEVRKSIAGIDAGEGWYFYVCEMDLENGYQTVSVTSKATN